MCTHTRTCIASSSKLPQTILAQFPRKSTCGRYFRLWGMLIPPGKHETHPHDGVTLQIPVQSNRSPPARKPQPHSVPQRLRQRHGQSRGISPLTSNVGKASRTQHRQSSIVKWRRRTPVTRKASTPAESETPQLRPCLGFRVSARA